MAFIAKTSQYIPEKIVRNEDMLQFPGRFRNLIANKAGILSRHHVSENECTSDIGARAVADLIKKSGIDPLDIEALICATSSPDRVSPATATRIQELCGLKNAFAFDINSVCSGAIYALRIAAGFVRDGMKKVIVVAAEVYSKICNPQDIAVYPYFGDGAAAALITADSGNYEIVDFILGSDGAKADSAQCGGGTMQQGTRSENADDCYFTMNGREIYDFACDKGPATLYSLIHKHNIMPDRIITHQANYYIISEIAKRTELPLEKFFINVDKYGNTAGASVLIALNESMEKNLDDENILLVAFGSGLSWGGCYLRKKSI